MLNSTENTQSIPTVSQIMFYIFDFVLWVHTIVSSVLALVSTYIIYKGVEVAKND